MHCSCRLLRAHCETRVWRLASNVFRLSPRTHRQKITCSVPKHQIQRSRLHDQRACILALKSAFVQSTPQPAATGACMYIADGHEATDAGSGGNGNTNSSSKPTGEDDGGGGSRGGSCCHPSFLQVLLSVLLPSMLLQLVHADAAAAWGRSQVVAKKDERLLPEWEIDAFVDRMWDLSGPIMNNMGFSGLVGAAAAAALKWVGRTLAASVGMTLILVQVLSYWNVVTVNWSVVHQQAAQVLDRTGDGRLDQDDFKRVVKKGMIILSEGVPSMSGFLVGFIVGLKVF